MSNSPLPPAGPSGLEPEFVAYLDGELDAAACRRIEDLLARDATARHRMEALERAWDLLDELPRRTLDTTFTRSTVEMIALAADGDQRARAAWWRHPRVRTIVFAAAALLLGGLAGYFAVGAWATNPNRQLLEDLPLLEDLDRYRQIDSIDFLRQLRDTGAFGKEGTHER